MTFAATTVDRRFRLALSLSALLHLGSLVVSQMQTRTTVAQPILPDLRLWIESPGEVEQASNEVTDVLRRQADPEAAAPLIPQSLVDEPLIDAAQQAPVIAAETPANEILTTSFESKTPVEISTPPRSLNNVLAAVGPDPEVNPPEPAALAESEAAFLADEAANWARLVGRRGKNIEDRVWRKKGREYRARVERIPTNSQTQLDRVTVIVVTERDGQKLETRIQLKRLAFSSFTQLVDQWDPAVQLHADEIHGRFHSNTEIQLGWDRQAAPRFLGQFTTAARGYNIVSKQGRRSRSEIFPAGVDLSANTIVLPRLALSADETQTSVIGRYRTFTSDTEIRFYDDGSYGWRSIGGNQQEQREPSADGPNYLLAARGVKLRVSGRFRGQTLVYSPKEIEIGGSVTYASDVRGSENSTDMLGIASDSEITVLEPDITGPGDLRIEAAVFARWRFVVTALGTKPPAVLSIYGSLSAGSISASEPRYATRIEFDPRLETRRPPGFPSTNRYDIENWDRRWRPAPSP